MSWIEEQYVKFRDFPLFYEIMNFENILWSDYYNKSVARLFGKVA